MGFLAAHSGNRTVCLGASRGGATGQSLPQLRPLQQQIAPSKPGGVRQGQGVIGQRRQLGGMEMACDEDWCRILSQGSIGGSVLAGAA